MRVRCSVDNSDVYKQNKLRTFPECFRQARRRTRHETQDLAKNREIERDKLPEGEGERKRRRIFHERNGSVKQEN